MGDVENMSDAELRTKLMEFGFPVMPITGTTRKLMMKKLKLLMENKNKSPKDGRLSLGRYSSEEESDTDVKSSKKDKNRRITMAAPPPQTPNRSGVTLRKSLHRNNNEEITMPSVSKDGLKSTKHITTTTKITKSVQDEFDTGSDSEPEIIENDYDSTSNITNSYGFRKEMAFSPSSMLNFENSSTKYARPQTVTSHFSSNYASSSTDKPISSSTRYTSYNSSTGNSGDATLDRLNQIRSRLSLGNQENSISTTTSNFISIFTILDFFEERETLEKAINAIASNCVITISFDPESSTVSGEVQATTKQRTYKVKVTVSNGTIRECNCNCYRASTTCYHIAALILCAHYNLIDTNQLHKLNKNELFGQLFETDKKNFLSEEIDREHDDLYKNLQLCSPLHFLRLLKPEPWQNKNILDINEIFDSEEYLEATNKRIFLEKHLQLTLAKIHEISEATVGQNNNPLWFTARKHRLTASNFGKIIKACRRKKFPPSLFNSLMGTRNISKVKQIEWGIINEKHAVTAFEKKKNIKVKETGLWLHQCGYLGGSPDGLLCDTDSIIEVKCPYKYKDKNLQDSLTTDRRYILRYDTDSNRYCVNSDHDYYHQIQGLLHILQKTVCHLIIWNPRELVIVDINKDERWKNNIKVLQDFYFDHYIKNMNKD